MWWVSLLQGLAAILLGILLVTDIGATLPQSINFLGIYWLILGVLALVQIFADRWINWLWSLFIGISGVIAGLFVLNQSLLLILIVPSVAVSLGVQGLTIGTLEIIAWLTGGGVGSSILGVTNLLIGFLLLRPPALVLVQASLIFGVLLLVQGIALLILAYRVRS